MANTGPTAIAARSLVAHDRRYSSATQAQCVMLMRYTIYEKIMLHTFEKLLEQYGTSTVMYWPVGI